MSKEKTDMVVGETTSESTELAMSSQTAMARHEIEGAIVIAQRFPRNEDAAFERVMKSAGRFMFAAKAMYSYPRGGSKVEGASVNLAREMARCWGNIRYGADVVHDDEESRTVRAWAWDVETNVKETQDVSFKKLIYRKQGGWIKPDERDLLEMTNSKSARAVRNCILHLIPVDLCEDAQVACKKTVVDGVEGNVDGHRKQIIMGFSTIGVSVDDLEVYLGHPLRQASPEEIANLRPIWKSISDGNSTWAEYVADKQPEKEPESGATVDDLTGKPKKKRGRPKKKPEPPVEPAGPEAGMSAVRRDEYREAIMGAVTSKALSDLNERAANDNVMTAGDKETVNAWCAQHADTLEASD